MFESIFFKLFFIYLITSSVQQSSDSDKTRSIDDMYRDLMFGDSDDGAVNGYNVTVGQLNSWLRELYSSTSTSSVAHLDCNDHSLDERSLRNCNAISEKCLKGDELLLLANQSGSITSTTLHNICPYILYQMRNDVCKTDFTSVHKEIVSRKPTSKEVWGYGVLFVTIISLCSICGIAILPLIGHEFYKKLLTYLVGLAVGSLVSSAVFHLIPQTFGLLDSGNHDYLWKALVISGGIYLFFFTERVMRILMVHKQRKKVVTMNGEKNALGNSVTFTVVPSDENKASCQNCEEPKEIHCNGNENNYKANDMHITEAHTLCHHDHNLMFKEGEGNTIATVAYMIIFGDGLHNFVDGLSIGAAFSESIMAGISISVAIICEEFPHELGDFAVLLNAGMSIKQAILYNFMSACTCYLGLIVGIVLGELEEASTYIFAIAGGMFLYISLVDMVPEMNITFEEASKKGTIEGVKVLIMQSIGIFTGVLALFVLALYTEQINFES